MAGGRPERNYLDREGYCIRVVTGDDASAIYEATREFIDTHDDGETVVGELLAVDGESETWTFADTSLDSGTFGEVVSAGIVEKVDGEYRVGNVEGVRVALEGEEFVGKDDEVSGFKFDFDVDYTRVGGLIGALLVVVIARTFYYRSVFVEGRVVSPGNDPYFFRYWQEQLVAESSGPFSFGVLVNPPWDDGSFNQRPLTHATNWWFTELLGGDQWAADMVTAWLPLVFTVLLAIVVYHLALVLTRDYRVGIASVLVLALAPVHANYTGLGLLHHRYNQYLWLGLILLTLAWLGTDVKRGRELVGGEQAVQEHISQRKTWAVALAFGLSLAAWTHSWGGSLELFAALGGFVGLRVCMDVRDGISPGLVNLPLVFGFGVGAGLALLLHLGLGWHGFPGPALSVVTFLGVVAVVGLGEFWSRQGLSARKLLVVQPVLAVVSATAVLVLIGGVSDIVDVILRNIGSHPAPDWQVSSQTNSLYTTDQFIIFGPIGQIGIEFYIGLMMLGWCFFYVYREYDPGWLLIAVVTTHYLIISGILVRFAGRLVIVMAVLAGLGIVYLLSALDLVRSPFPLRQSSEQSQQSLTTEAGTQPKSTESSLNLRRSGLIIGIGLLIFSASLMFVPSLMGQVTNDRVHVETAMVISEHAEALDREYPENHVLAPWGEYRLYNYFVSGESESEGLGRYSYTPLLIEENIDNRLDALTDRIGYLVLAGPPVDVSGDREQLRLTDQLGLPDDRFESLEHYRLISIDEDADIAVFSIVSGAQIELEDVEEDTVEVKTEVTVSDRRFTYSREIPVGEDGSVSLTVPYPGTYEIAGESVVVEEEDVRDGNSIVVTHSHED